MGQINRAAPPPSPHTPPNVQCAQGNKAGGAAAAADDLSKSGKVLTATSAAATAAAAVDKRKKKKQPPAERPPDVCRDPITLDDLGSWTWDFRASEAATPPVSCGATRSTKHGGGGGWKGKRFGVEGKGGRGCGGGGSGSGSGVSGSGSGSTSSAVVTYNVESLVLYLLESGDFQVRRFDASSVVVCCRWCSRRCCDHG